MSETKDKPVYYVDASSLSNAACLRKFYYNCIRGLHHRAATSYKMSYGTAVHKFLQAYYSGMEPKEAIILARDYYAEHVESVPDMAFHTATHLIKTCKEYVLKYPLDTDGLVPAINEKGKHLVEQTFAYPYYQSEEFDVVTCGTIDFIGSYFGTEAVVDHKTTGSWNKGEFFEGFKLAFQTLFYVWHQKLLFNQEYYLPIVINGIFLKKQTKASLSSGNFDGVTFERSPIIEYSDAQMADFENILDLKMNEIIKRLHLIHGGESLNQQNFGKEISVCKTYGLCPYFSICSNPGLEESIINANYEATKYEPLKFQA